MLKTAVAPPMASAKAVTARIVALRLLRILRKLKRISLPNAVTSLIPCGDTYTAAAHFYGKGPFSTDCPGNFTIGSGVASFNSGFHFAWRNWRAICNVGSEAPSTTAKTPAVSEYITINPVALNPTTSWDHVPMFIIVVL